MIFQLVTLKNTLSLDFYPRTPTGCDLPVLYYHPAIENFYPRTPAGCDPNATLHQITKLLFLSTHPCRVRHFTYIFPSPKLGISIHAPLRGATIRQVLSTLIIVVFLSAHPCGVRLLTSPTAKSILNFYPRTPAGCDLIFTGLLLLTSVFLSTHPCGVRLAAETFDKSAKAISIHAPLRGATWYWHRYQRHFNDFYPRTPAGCDL